MDKTIDLPLQTSEKFLEIPIQTRAATFGGVNVEDRTVSFSFSSDTPINQPWGVEILSHEPGAMVTDRLDKKAVPFLKDHQFDAMAGKIVAYSVEGGRAYGTAKLSRSTIGKELLMEIEDGRTEISVGYLPREVSKLKTERGEDEKYLVTRWEVLEVSSVSVPMDYSIGIGRGSDEKKYKCRVLSSDSKPPVAYSFTEKDAVKPAADPNVVASVSAGPVKTWEDGVTSPVAVQPNVTVSETGVLNVTIPPVTEPLPPQEEPEPNQPDPQPMVAPPAAPPQPVVEPVREPVLATRTITPEPSVIIPDKTSAPKEDFNMSEQTAPPQQMKVEVTKEPHYDVSKDRESEIARIRELSAMGARFNCADDANQYIRLGKSVAEFNSFIIEHKVFSTAPIRAVDPSLGMRPQDQRRYCLTRAILAQSEGKLGGFELECSKELEAQLGRRASGFFVPEFAFTHIGTRASPPDLTALVTSEGKETIQTSVEPSLIPFLRNKTVVGKAGATMMGGLVGNLSLPRQISAATATWNTENQDPTRTGLTFDQVPLNPQRLSAVTAFSKQLLAQSQLDVQLIVRDDLMKIIAIEQDRVALAGTGAGNAPTGILGTTADTVWPSAYSKTSPSVVFAGGGSGFPTWTNVVTFESSIEQNNVDLDDMSCAYIMSPQVKGFWKTVAKVDSRATNQFYPEFLFEDVQVGTGEPAGRVNGYKAFATNQLSPTNQVIFGRFSDLIIGVWGGIDLLVDPYTLASTFQVRVIINLLTTIALRYGPSFVYSTNSGM